MENLANKDIVEVNVGDNDGEEDYTNARTNGLIKDDPKICTELDYTEKFEDGVIE